MRQGTSLLIHHKQWPVDIFQIGRVCNIEKEIPVFEKNKKGYLKVFI